jgi:DoxX-like family
MAPATQINTNRGFAVAPAITTNNMTTIYIYWISTALLTLLYLSSAIMYLTKGNWVRQVLADLGYPAYLVPVMTIVKVLGPAAILLRINVGLSDLAYAGVFYHLLLAGLAHVAVRKPKGALPAVIGLALLVTSFITQNTARGFASPYGPF